MTRIRLASFVLAAALVPSAAVMAQNAPPDRGAPPPTRPGGGTGGASDGASGDGMRGPRVPGAAGEGDRGFGGERGGRAAMRGDEGESLAWLKALDEISRDFSPEQGAKIKAARDAWTKESDDWRTANGQKLRDLQKKLSEGRKDGGTPDPALMDQMKVLIESRPKFNTTRKRIEGFFTREQSAAHKAAFDAQRKKMTPMEKPRGADGAPGRPGGDAGGNPDKQGRGGPPEGGRPSRGRDGSGTGAGSGGAGSGDGEKPPAAPPAAPPAGGGK